MFQQANGPNRLRESTQTRRRRGRRWPQLLAELISARPGAEARLPSGCSPLQQAPDSPSDGSRLAQKASHGAAEGGTALAAALGASVVLQTSVKTTWRRARCAA